MHSSGTPDAAALEATKQSVRAAATALDPAKVLQLVVQLAEKTQEVDALQQQLLHRDQRIAALEATNAELAASSEALRTDVDQLPAVLQRAEAYKTKWRLAKKEMEALTAAHTRDYDELKETAHAVSAENDDLRGTIKSSTRRFVAQLEAAEDSILSLQNEVDRLKETIREVEAERVQRRLQLQQEQELAEANSRFAKKNVAVEAVPAVKAASAQAGEAYAMWINPGRTQTVATQTVRVNDLLAVTRRGEATGDDEEVAEAGGQQHQRGSNSDDASASRATASPSRRHHDYSRARSGWDRGIGTMPRAILEPSVMQLSLLQSSDEAMAKMIDDGEVLHRRQIERQIKVHDRLLATVASIQKEAVRAPAAPPLHF